MLTFLNKLLSDRGYPIAWTIDRDGRKKNHLFHSVEAMASALEGMDRTYPAVYFGLGTAREQRKGEHINGQYVSAKLRTTDNMFEYKALWMDIDIDPDDAKHYASKKDALRGLVTYLEATALTAPMIVDSGNGLHLYWPLVTAINIDQWRSIASKIVAVVLHTGFKVDVNCLKLATQVLRPVGTHHRKDPDNPKRITILRDATATNFELLEQRYNAYIEKHQVSITPIVESKQTFAALAAASGFTYTAPMRLNDPVPVIKGCKQMRVAAECSEPMWRGMLSTIVLCRGGLELAHMLSARDPRYTVDDTDVKLAEIKQSQNGAAMPYTCAKFDELNPGVCGSCPNNGKVKSPIVLGIPEEVEVVEGVVPDVVIEPTHYIMQGVALPPTTPLQTTMQVYSKAGAYVLEVDGIYMFVPNGDEGTEKVKICNQRVYPIDHIYQFTENGNKEFFYVWRIENNEQDYNDCIIAGNVIHNEQSVLSEFTKYGVVIEKKANFNRFGNYMRAFISKIKDEMPAREMYPTLGWQNNGDFVTGLYVVKPDGHVERAMLADEALDQATICNMQPEGDFAKWREAIDVFNKPGQEHAQLAVCGAFAGPLIKHTSIRGIILSLQGVTGSGKTAMQLASASVWGNPREQITTAPNTSIGESLVSVVRMIGVNKNLPVNIEEITNMPVDKISDFVHAMSLGAEKSRLRSGKNSTYARSKGLSWETAFVTSSNELIRDKLSTAKHDSQAESMRVFEIRNIKLVKNTDIGGDTVRLKQVEDHYGHAGLHYAKFLQANRHNITQWLSDRVLWLTEEVKATQDERFWVQGMAAWLVGIELSRLAGIHDYDVEALEKYIIKQYYDQRMQVKLSKEYSATTFSEMINDLLNEAVIIDSGNTLANNILTDTVLPRSGKLHMRIEIEQGVGYVDAARVKQWAKYKDIPHSSLLNNGENSGYIDTSKTTKKVLGKSVKGLMGGGQVRCYEFKLPPDDIKLLQYRIMAENEVSDGKK